MTDMVESLAMALRERHKKVGVQPWAEMNEKNQQYWRDEARFVLGHIRKPSEAMMTAGRPWAISSGAPPNCWLKMIDAALREDKP